MDQIGDLMELTTLMGRKVQSEIKGEHTYINTEKLEVTGWEYDSRALVMFSDRLVHDIQHKYSPVIMVTGEERTGKSTFILSVCPLVSPTFGVDDICFEIPEFRMRNKTRGRGDSIVFDEAGHGLFNQTWYEAWQKTIYKQAQVQAKRQIIWWLALPYKDDLNPKFQRHRVDYWVDIFTKNSKELRGFAEIRYAKKSKWEPKIWWEPLIAVRFDELSTPLWNVYEGKKDLFIAKVIDEDLDTDDVAANKWDSRAIPQRDRAVMMLNDGIKGKSGIGQRELAKIFHVDQSTVSDWVRHGREAITATPTAAPSRSG